MRRDEWCSFFCCAIDIRWDCLPMPMKLFWDVCFVMNLYRDPLALFEAQEGARKLAVVSGHRHDSLGGHFDGFCLDGEGVVGWRVGLREQ